MQLKIRLNARLSHNNTQMVIAPKTLNSAHSRNVSSSEHITMYLSMQWRMSFPLWFSRCPCQVVNTRHTVLSKLTEKVWVSLWMDNFSWIFLNSYSFQRRVHLCNILFCYFLDGHRSHCTVESICVPNVILFVLPPHELTCVSLWMLVSSTL